MGNLRRHTKRGAVVWLTAITLTVFAWPAVQAGETEAGEAKGEKSGQASVAAAAQQADNPTSVLEQVGAWSRLLQIVANTGIPLEGLIKPENTGTVSRNRICDNEAELLSGNRTSLFSGNSATGKFSILTGVNIHLDITIQNQGNLVPAATSTSDALDIDGNQQEYLRIKAIKRTRKLRKRLRSRSAVSERSERAK